MSYLVFKRTALIELFCSLLLYVINFEGFFFNCFSAKEWYEKRLQFQKVVESRVVYSLIHESICKIHSLKVIILVHFIC